METKKHSSQDLQSRYGLHLAFGLSISIFLVILAFEWKTPYNSEFVSFGYLDEPPIIDDPELLPPVATYKPPPPKPIVNPKQVIMEEPPRPHILKILNQNQSDVPDMDPVTIDLPPEVAEVYDGYVDRSAEPAKGWQHLQKYLTGSMRYPRRARDRGIEGTVYISFTVDKDGKIKDVAVEKGLGYGCDEEAIRVVSAMPGWIPAARAGLPVAVKMLLPIQFKLQ